LSENSALFNKLFHITIRRNIFLPLTVWNFIDLVSSVSYIVTTRFITDLWKSLPWVEV